MVKPYGHDKTMRSMIALLCEYNKVKDCQKTSIQSLCRQHGYRIDTILPPPVFLWRVYVDALCVFAFCMVLMIVISIFLQR